jgi:hypothetical protein
MTDRPDFDRFLDDLAKLTPAREKRAFSVPDLIQAVEGWRAWAVSSTPPRYGGVPVLRSVSYAEHFWPPRSPMQAVCNRRKHNDAEVIPVEGCSCGFYSAKTLNHLLKMRYHRYDADASGFFHVVGQVANWGKVIEGTQGWRAAISYPVKLLVPFEAWRLVEALEDAYGVPVELSNTLALNQLRTNQP